MLHGSTVWTSVNLLPVQQELRRFPVPPACSLTQPTMKNIIEVYPANTSAGGLGYLYLPSSKSHTSPLAKWVTTPQSGDRLWLTRWLVDTVYFGKCGSSKEESGRCLEVGRGTSLIVHTCVDQGLELRIAWPRCKCLDTDSAWWLPIFRAPEATGRNTLLEHFPFPRP